MKATLIESGIKEAEGLLSIDTIPANWIEDVLFVVQNLAENRSDFKLPDGTKAYYPRQVLEMRQTLFPTATERELNCIVRTPEEIGPIATYVRALGNNGNFPLVQRYLDRYAGMTPEQRANATARMHLGIEAAERCLDLLEEMSNSTTNDNS